MAHLVESHSKVVTFLVELCLLSKVELLGELRFILALPQLLFQGHALAASLELLLYFSLKLFPNALVFFYLVHETPPERALLETFLLYILQKLVNLTLISQF